MSAGAVRGSVETVRRSAADAGGYARALGVEDDVVAPSLPVLVQRFVEPRAAGVVFTRHPTDPAAMLVEAHAGRGEWVVSGTARPDRYVLDRETGALRDGAGQGSLGEADLREVFALARRAEALLGAPQDVEAIDVIKSPFLVEYGRLTSGVVAVETHRGGDKWHAELNDPFPDFRIRSGRMEGLRNSTPRALVGGPVIQNRLYLITELQYYLDKHPNLTLPYPYNESKQELVNSYTQFDYIISRRHLLTASIHVTPEHINFVDPEYFNPQPVTPSYAQQDYEWTMADHLAIGGGIRLQFLGLVVQLFSRCRVGRR